MVDNRDVNTVGLLGTDSDAHTAPSSYYCGLQDNWHGAIFSDDASTSKNHSLLRYSLQDEVALVTIALRGRKRRLKFVESHCSMGFNSEELHVLWISGDAHAAVRVCASRAAGGDHVNWDRRIEQSGDGRVQGSAPRRAVVENDQNGDAHNLPRELRQIDDAK